jgi:ABC-2 type transport system permease protein
VSTATHSLRVFARLRWRLFRGAFRLGGAEQVGAVLSIVASAVIGVVGCVAAVAAGRSDEHASLAVLICAGAVVAVLGLGIVAGVSQPIDPRVVAHEPLSERDRGIGLLAAAAVGPPGLAGAAIGVALAVGFTQRLVAAPVVVLAAASWLVSLLLIARTATNALSLLLARAPRAGQFAAAIGGLVFYGLFQLVPAVAASLDRSERADLAAFARWTPAGQLGAAINAANESAPGSVWHLLIGSVWLVPLWWAFARSTERLSVAVRSSAHRVADGDGPLRRFVRRLCGDGPIGAIAWRSLLTRFRTPRTALETVTGAGVGLAAVLAPALLRDDPGSGAVLVGGAIQLAVLFVAGNSFGNDGPAIAYELLAGITPRIQVAGKARSIVIVGAPLALAGPLLAAALTREWAYLPAGFGVGIGGLLAGVGAAVVQSALVPIAVPDTDNPFASGESGKGMLAAGLLVLVLVGLTIATVPVGLALFWATDQGNVTLVTVFGAFTIVAGWIVLLVGRSIATRRLTGRDEAFLASVTPAR